MKNNSKYIPHNLENNKMLMIMLFYSILTFVIGPMITKQIMNEHPDYCVGGYVLGFAVSVLLWMKVGRNY